MLRVKHPAEHPKVSGVQWYHARVNRAEFIRNVAELTGQSACAIDEALTAMIDVIASAMHRGESVNLRTFGKFEPRHRAPVVRVHPTTGEQINVPAKTAVAFVPSDVLKERANGHDGERED